MQTCNGFHQSPIDVKFTGTPVDDATDADANGELTFSGYDQVRAFLIENTVEHYDTFTPEARANKLKNKGGKTVVSILSINSKIAYKDKIIFLVPLNSFWSK